MISSDFWRIASYHSNGTDLGYIIYPPLVEMFFCESLTTYSLKWRHKKTHFELSFLSFWLRSYSRGMDVTPTAITRSRLAGNKAESRPQSHSGSLKSYHESRGAVQRPIIWTKENGGPTDEPTDGRRDGRTHPLWYGVIQIIVGKIQPYWTWSGKIWGSDADVWSWVDMGIGQPLSYYICLY